jgi:hypothetical protein
MTEAPERLIRAARIAAVDVDLGVAVLEVAPRSREVDADLAGKLLGEPDHELVHERLV